MRLAGGGFAVEMTTKQALLASKDNTVFHFMNNYRPLIYRGSGDTLAIGVGLTQPLFDRTME